ncbi:unnamed protein product [Phytomonas sp. Hart1]|nr:unnamed protein product [Phytomonas sp. Hart1]|eukprot:CCW68916.1 unnamed protein product [Phytomonas sp. isolate Hart1]
MEEEINFLNNSLSNARQVHILVSASFAAARDEGTSILLGESVQTYLNYLYTKYSNNTALQSRLKSGKCLHFLGCLIDADSRMDFLRLASNPGFINTD